METISTNRSFNGTQGVYSHKSDVCDCDMTFAVYVPDVADTQPCPVIWYLSGLTCTHANVMDKGEYRRWASDLGVIIVCPDTSPRGENVPDDADNWQFGSGAGFYLNATQEPWRKNYQMYSYVTEELPALIAKEFPADMDRQSIMGHSMGGHGALTIALRNPEKYKSVSAFAPIVEPSTADWSSSAFKRYLGEDTASWEQYDATALVKSGASVPEILIDQGSADGFLDDGLRPWLLEDACKDTSINLTSRMQDGYDHSYYFISTFMEDHMKWHAERL